MKTVLYFYSKILMRSSKDLFLSFASLFIGIFLFALIFNISTSVSDYFYKESSTLVGGDIKYSSSKPITLSDEILALQNNNDIVLQYEKSAQATLRTDISSSTTPVSVRAVDNNFPLYGELKLSDSLIYTNARGVIYVESKALSNLNIAIGDNIYIGDLKLRVGGVIADEPDKVSSSFSFTPKVIINLEDSDLLGITSDNGRVSHKIGFKIVNQGVLALQTLTNFAEQNKIRYDSSIDGPDSLLIGFKSVATFIGIAISISLFLVYVNIAANLAILLFRFRKSIALFKVFGLTNNKLYAIYILIFTTIATLSGLLGSLLAIYVSKYLLSYINTNFGLGLNALNNTFTILFSTLFSIILILLSAIPFLRDLANLRAKALLTSNQINGSKVHTFLSYIFVPILLFVSMYLLTRDLLLSLYSIGGLTLLFVFYFYLTKLITDILYKVRGRFSVTIFSILSFLKWRSVETYIIGASIMTALSGVFIITTVEENIKLNINKDVSRSAPSMYIVNIGESKLGPVVSMLQGEKYNVYNIIRGRLISVGDRVIGAQESGEFTREFNLTYRDSLAEGEEIVSGVWHSKDTSYNQVSIDREFAKELGAELGDEVQVFIQGFTVSAKITSVRKTNQSNGTPFFYLVYSNGVIDNFPKNYFITTNVSDDKVAKIESELATNYPNIIAINTTNVITQINSILNQITNLVNIIGLPSIILGILLTITMTIASAETRLRDILTMIVIGLKRSKTKSIIVLENLSLLAVSGFISYILAHIIVLLLNYFIFDFNLFTLAITPLYILSLLFLFLYIFTSIFITRILSKPLKSLLGNRE